MNKLENFNIIGKYIKELREKRGLSINQLSLYSGVSSSYISRIENGKRKGDSPEILEKLAPILKVSYEDLLIKAGILTVSPSIDDQKKMVEEALGEDAFVLYRRLRDATPEQLKHIKAILDVDDEEK